MPENSAPQTDDVAAVRAVPQRITAAWASYDAAAFADVFTDDATMILPNVYLDNKVDIKDYMARGFAGPYQGTRVFGEPISARFISTDTAVLVTKGGVLAPGETEVAPERAVRATWVIVKKDEGWQLAAYQNTPIVD
jgi:uncharacterized protein (TIGR02246 family)